MKREEYKPGLRVWYEPSPGVRFLGETVDDAPRKLGDSYVTTVAMTYRHYGLWRGKARDGGYLMSVPSAALDRLHLDTGLSQSTDTEWCATCLACSMSQFHTPCRKHACPCDWSIGESCLKCLPPPPRNPSLGRQCVGCDSETDLATTPDGKSWCRECSMLHDETCNMQHALINAYNEQTRLANELVAANNRFVKEFLA